MEIYNLMNHDIPTTANLDISLISDAMLLCYNRLHAAGLQFPKGLRVHADNCTSETKNQVAFKAGAFMICQGFFDVIVWSYFQTDCLKYGTCCSKNRRCKHLPILSKSWRKSNLDNRESWLFREWSVWKTGTSFWSHWKLPSTATTLHVE